MKEINYMNEQETTEWARKIKKTIGANAFGICVKRLKLDAPLRNSVANLLLDIASDPYGRGLPDPDSYHGRFLGNLWAWYEYNFSTCIYTS